MLLLLLLLCARGDALDTAELFHVCSHSVVCARIYYLEHAANLSVSRDTQSADYRKFAALTARFDLQRHLALPAEWAPPLPITLPGNSSAQRALDLAAPHNTQRVYATLLALQTYGMFVVPQQTCGDRNERLYMLPDGTFTCLCVAGYSCANEARFATVLEVLLIIFFLAFFAWIISNFYTTFAMTARLQQAVARLGVTT